MDLKCDGGMGRESEPSEPADTSLCLVVSVWEEQ